MNDETLQCRWLVEDRVRLVTVRNDLTSELVHANDRETVALMDGLSASLHIIVDLREIRSFPPLNEILNLQYLRHPQMGWLLTVGAARGRITRFFLNAVGMTTRVHYKDFDDVNEAIAFLESCEPWIRDNLAV